MALWIFVMFSSGIALVLLTALVHARTMPHADVLASVESALHSVGTVQNGEPLPRRPFRLLELVLHTLPTLARHV